MKTALFRRVSFSVIFAALAALTFLPLLASCSASGGDTVMVVGGNKVGYDQYRYFYLNYRSSHENAGETDYAAALKSEVEDSLKQKYAKENLAAKYGVTLGSDDLAEVKAKKREYIDAYGGEAEFKAALSENSLTEKVFDDLIRSQTLETKLRDYMSDEYSGKIASDDATVEKYINEHFIHATHIMILNEAGDDIAANLRLAKELRARAEAGEDFNGLIKQYNEDPGMSDGDTDGYYFAEGQLLPEFENAAKALKIGDISDVVLSGEGYHIIKRLPLDADYINAHFEELRGVYKAKIFNDTVKETASSLGVEYTDFYKTLTDAGLVSNALNKES